MARTSIAEKAAAEPRTWAQMSVDERDKAIDVLLQIYDLLLNSTGDNHLIRRAAVWATEGKQLIRDIAGEDE